MVVVRSPEYTAQSLRVFTHVESVDALVPRRSFKKIEKALGNGATVRLTSPSMIEIDCPDQAVAKFGLALIESIVKSSSAPITINLQDSFLLMHAVPSSHIPYIMGRNQQYMSSLEEELGVVCFMCDDREAKTVHLTDDNPSTGFAPMDKFLHTKKPPHPAVVWVAIYSTSLKSRVGMKLKLMNAIESKMKGFYTVFGNHLNLNTTPHMHYSVSGLAVDTFPIAEEELSLALGKSGANKRRVAATSGCVVEYVGRCAFMFGTIEERQMARNFLTIVLERGRGVFTPQKWTNAVGVVTMNIPTDKVGIVTGKAGVGLHQIEETCSCMCFMEGHRPGSPGAVAGAAASGELPPLPPPVQRQNNSGSDSINSDVVMVILGSDENTGKAARQIRDRMGISRSDLPTPSVSPSPKVRDDDAVSMFRQIFRNGKLVSDGNSLYKQILRAGEAASNGELNVLESSVPDTTVMEVPSSHNLQTLLKQLEDEYGVVCGNAAHVPGGPPESSFVIIVGSVRPRRSVELKIMSTVENKQRGFYSHRIVRDNLRVCDKIWSVKTDQFDTDTVPIPEENLSFALGQKGSIRKKLAIASGCIIEYIGECAYLSGSLVERARGRDYLRWVLQQLDGEVTVNDYANRVDVSAIVIPKRAAGFVNGNKGRVLRNVEEITGTFCFIGKSADGGSTKPLFVCGPNDTYRNAAVMLLEQYIKRHEGSDWMNDATEASAEMEKDVLEKNLREMGIKCEVTEPWKIPTTLGTYSFVCQPCPGAARPDAELISDSTSSPLLARRRSKKNSAGKFVNDEESFPELGGMSKRTSLASPQPHQEDSPLSSPKSPSVPSPPRSPPAVVAESPDRRIDSGITFDYENGQVWGDWGLGPNGDPTNGKPARKSLGGIRSVPQSPPQPTRSGVWK